MSIELRNVTKKVRMGPVRVTYSGLDLTIPDGARMALLGRKEAGLEKIVPERYLLHAHHWLILHGRYICVARRPRCPDCLIADICRFPDKTQPLDGKSLVERI